MQIQVKYINFDGLKITTMFKRMMFLMLMALVSSSLSAQLVQDLYRIYQPTYTNNAEQDSTAVITPFGIIKPGVNYGLSLGAGYSSFGNGRGMTNSYVAPTISYSPSQKLQVIGGVTLARNGMHGLDLPKEAGNNQLTTTSNPYQAWAYTQYNFNNRFSVYAMGAISQNQSFYSPISRGVGTYNSQMYGVGFNYKISSRATIGASFNFLNLQSLQNSFTEFGNPIFQ